MTAYTGRSCIVLERLSLLLVSLSLLKRSQDLLNATSSPQHFIGLGLSGHHNMSASDKRNWHRTPVDGYPTPTSDLQKATEDILHEHWDRQISTNSGDIPTLQKNSHIQFLLRNLVQGFPARYTSQDASQPWLIFWTLQGFSVLGVGIDAQTKKRYAGLYIIE